MPLQTTHSLFLLRIKTVGTCRAATNYGPMHVNPTSADSYYHMPCSSLQEHQAVDRLQLASSSRSQGLLSQAEQTPTENHYGSRHTIHPEAHKQCQGLVEGRWNIDSSETFVSRKDSFEENHRGDVILNHWDYQPNLPARVSHRFRQVV